MYGGEETGEGEGSTVGGTVLQKTTVTRRGESRREIATKRSGGQEEG